MNRPRWDEECREWVEQLGTQELPDRGNSGNSRRSNALDRLLLPQGAKIPSPSLLAGGVSHDRKVTSTMENRATDSLQLPFSRKLDPRPLKALRILEALVRGWEGHKFRIYADN